MQVVGEIPGTRYQFASGGVFLLVDESNCSPYFRRGRGRSLSRPHEWGELRVAPLLVKGILKLERMQREKRWTLGIAACVNARAMLEEQLLAQARKERGITV